MRMRRALSVTLAALATLTLASCGLPSPLAKAAPSGPDGLDAIVAGMPEVSGAAGFYDYLGYRWDGTGPVYGDVTISAVSDSRLQQIVDELGRFLARERGGPVSREEIDLHLGGFSLDVSDRRDENDELREVYRALDADDGIEHGRIGRYTWVDAPRDDVLDAFTRLGSALARSDFVGSHGVQAYSDDRDGDITIYADSIDEPPQGTARAFQQLDDTFDVRTADIEVDSLDITVAPADLEAAQLAAAKLQASESWTISVTSSAASGSLS